MDDREITNTARMAKDNPLLMLATLMGGPPGGIEAQEAQGQRELVASRRIPTGMRNVTAEQMTALGFVLGDPDPADPIFRPATLPGGWTWRATDHSMWSEILDARGRRRFEVFYKAAFYDRSAFLRPAARFGLDVDYGGDQADLKLCRIYLADQGRRGELLASYRDDVRGDYDRGWKEARAAMAARYPDYLDPMAYWD